MSKKTKHERLLSYRNNAQYFFIADTDRKIYHRKDCAVLDSADVRKNSLMPLRRTVGQKWKPCPHCAPIPVEPEQKEKLVGPLGEQLCRVAKRYGMQAKLFGSSIYITTIHDEWFFNYQSSSIVLHHKNTEKRTDWAGRTVAGDYHRQPNEFDTPFQALLYIRNHTQAVVNRECAPAAVQLKLVTAPHKPARLFCGETELFPGCSVTALFPNGWQKVILDVADGADDFKRWYIVTQDFDSYSPVGLFVSVLETGAG